jgi:hypothetical protein
MLVATVTAITGPTATANITDNSTATVTATTEGFTVDNATDTVAATAIANLTPQTDANVATITLATKQPPKNLIKSEPDEIDQSKILLAVLKPW